MAHLGIKMPEDKEQKKEYIVTEPNTKNHAVGDRVKLTEAEARRLVNKVRPADQVPGAGGSDTKGLNDKIAKLNAELEAAKAENLKLAEDVAKLNAELEAATAPKSKAGK